MGKRPLEPIRALAVSGIVLFGASACDDSLLLGGAASGEPRCESAIQARLARYGVKLDEMSNKRWYRDTFAREGGAGQTSGYRFYGRPASCASGDVAIALWPNCGIQSVRARGDCELAEVRE